MKKYQLLFAPVLLLFLSSCSNNQTINFAPFFWGEVELTYEVFSDPIDLTQVVTLHDSEDGDILVTSSMIDDASLDYNEVGSYSITYTFTDSGGLTAEHLLTINIVDTENPIITLAGDNFVKIVQGEEFIIPDLFLSDNFDNIFLLKVLGDTLDTDIPGTYHLTFSISDSSGNSSNIINYTVYVLLDVEYDYNLGDEVHMSGYYSTTKEGSALNAEIGFFKVQDIQVSEENPIGLSTLLSDEIIFWTKDEYLINRDDFTSGSVVDLEVPLLHQFDYSGNLTGSSLTISGYGCALTALTMVINYMNDTDFTPEETNPDLVIGGLVYWVNTDVSKYSNINPNYYPSYNQYRTEILFSNEEAYLLLQMHIKDKLDEGIPVLVKIKGSTTHYVVAKGYGYDIYGKMYIEINDPGSSYRFYLHDLPASYQYFYEGFIYYTE